MSRNLPSYKSLMFPVIEALTEMGGSGLRNEIVETVIDRQKFSDEQLEQCYETSGASIIPDRIGWALSYLKKMKAVENSRRGVWTLTVTGKSMNSEKEVHQHLKIVQSKMAARAAATRRARQETVSEASDEEALDPEAGFEAEGEQWKTQLLQRLLRMTPDAFERLTQRLLREAGFRDVEVLGKSGDGGIDGVGVYRLSLVSFPIYFQCKRWKGSVSAGMVRDFRGAMAGRGEKGLLVTTGTFTRDARKESNRDGASPVQLIDGEELCELLKEYELGVHAQIRQIEDVSVDTDFFEEFEQV